MLQQPRQRYLPERRWGKGFAPPRAAPKPQRGTECCKRNYNGDNTAMDRIKCAKMIDMMNAAHTQCLSLLRICRRSKETNVAEAPNHVRVKQQTPTRIMGPKLRRHPLYGRHTYRRRAAYNGAPSATTARILMSQTATLGKMAAPTGEHKG